MPHKYLNDIKIKSNECCIFNTEDNSFKKKRLKVFKKQRKKFGFDERETWNMDYTYATWIYSHFMWYKEYAPIDLTWHKIKIPKWNNKKKRICKKKKIEVNQKEAIDIVLNNLKFYLQGYDNVDFDLIEMTDKFDYTCKIIGIIMPCMWW